MQNYRLLHHRTVVCLASLLIGSELRPLWILGADRNKVSRSGASILKASVNDTSFEPSSNRSVMGCSCMGRAPDIKSNTHRRLHWLIIDLKHYPLFPVAARLRAVPAATKVSPMTSRKIRRSRRIAGIPDFGRRRHADQPHGSAPTIWQFRRAQVSAHVS